MDALRRMASGGMRELFWGRGPGIRLGALRLLGVKSFEVPAEAKEGPKDERVGTMPAKVENLRGASRGLMETLRIPGGGSSIVTFSSGPNLPLNPTAVGGARACARCCCLSRPFPDHVQNAGALGVCILQAGPSALVPCLAVSVSSGSQSLPAASLLHIPLNTP